MRDAGGAMTNPRQFAKSDLVPVSATRAALHAICVGLAPAFGLIAALSGGSVQAEPAAKPTLSSTLDQIQNQYATDPVAARKKYQSVAVQFTSMAGDVTGSPAQGLTVDFHTAQHPQPIRALFPASGSQAAPSIHKGSLVQAHCEFIVEVANKPELRGCRVR